MAEGRRQLDEARRRADALQRLDDAPRFGGGVKPVGIEADEREAHILRLRECAGKAAVVRVLGSFAVPRGGPAEYVHSSVPRTITNMDDTTNYAWRSE